MSSYTTHMTEYGELNAISIYDTYADHQLKDCVVNEKFDLQTSVGLLTPQYEHATVRRKHIYSVSFFRNGRISRIALNEQTKVRTPLGMLPAELITFYESGSIKRLFPLNGQISGYWGEEDEYTLAEELHFSFPFGDIKAKIIGICLSEDGTVKSFTFWPKEIVSIKTPIGEHSVRIGISLYPNGHVKSFEPAGPIDVMTPIGLIKCYDMNANGMSGDSNSINFTEDGRIKSLIVSGTKITVAGQNTTKTYSPTFIRDMVDQELFFQSLNVAFENDCVVFNGQDEYLISDNRFTIEPYHLPKRSKCADCSSCSQCGSGAGR